MGPLREALTRLTGDGLVTFEENKCYRVAPVSRGDLMDLAEVRAHDTERRDLEALREAIRAGVESGPAIPAEVVFADLRARYTKA
ncbi:hypothetical protein [Brucella pituitosa]|uniref:hypothetical protein n=1 Tax=Brucella pituitosa TaxID=571256 RepID=UPI003F4AD03B